MDLDLISIIIPIYNSADFLEYNLNSILMQDYNKYEVLMIDDGSTDESAKICKKFAKKDNRFKYFYQQNGGVSSARNYGINLAKGKYVLFIDSDDLLSQHILKKASANFTGEFELLRYNYKRIYNHLTFLTDENQGTYKKNETQTDFIKHILLDGDGFLWNKIYLRRLIVDNNIKFNENITICEDLLFNIQYAYYIKKSVVLLDVGYGYYQSEKSSYNKIDNLKWFTVIDAYKEIEKELLRNNKDLYIFGLYEELYTNCEAIARNNINTKKYKNIKNIKNFIKQNILKVVFSKKIAIKLKIKLILFWIFPNIIYKYKTKKIGVKRHEAKK